ncbi:unnamed protein product [Paramecium pentaurelia]|uniref:Uncharacterized protein n=1 Tax=Paramecium pentaurelia TaxID=43138 RepID=A0A8S1SE62_9CILI|nr:unnamed protein product [Paramecium pentaurelia]
MFIINKTPNTITLSQPDLQEYQDFFNHEDPRKNQSVTIYDRIKKVNSNQNQNLQFSSKLSNLSLTKTTFNNINTLYQFTKKTLKQINQKQEITLSQNFVTSMKESNLFIYNVAQNISKFIKTDKVAIVPPHKIIGNWVQQLKSKCLKKKSPQNSQYPNHNTGSRDEDDDLIII